MKITKKDWDKIDEIGIDRNLLEESECGISFKTVGASIICSYYQKAELVKLNTEIQSR